MPGLNATREGAIAYRGPFLQGAHRLHARIRLLEVGNWRSTLFWLTADAGWPLPRGRLAIREDALDGRRAVRQDQESTRDANPRAVRGRSIDAVPNKSLELTPKASLARTARLV